MITRTETTVQMPDWQKELASAIREPRALLEALQLDPGQLPQLAAGQALFPIRVTRSFLSRIQPGQRDDPLLLQVLPQQAETLEVEGFSDDPVGDCAANAGPGLLHKYANRALLLVTAACAIHCRYCFRRNFPYSEARAEDHQFQAALDYLRDHSEVDEVILSGGDPLALNDARLGELFHQLEAIPHLQTLRIHSRLPIVLPDRVTPELLRLLGGSRMQTVMVVHCNHPAEVDSPVGRALARLHASGLTLLNQAVLLRGVNDSTDTLEQLSRTLFQHRVLPYYLHLLDRTRGTAHFEVGEVEARELIQQLRSRIAGYLVPRLVREQTGAGYKLPAC